MTTFVLVLIVVYGGRRGGSNVLLLGVNIETVSVVTYQSVRLTIGIEYQPAVVATTILKLISSELELLKVVE